MKVLLVPVGLIIAVFSEAQPVDEIERLAGFARLYGVVRYFHPSDAAQEVNWDQFDLIVAINGQPAAEWLTEKRALISGSEGWKDYRLEMTSIVRLNPL